MTNENAELIETLKRVDGDTYSEYISQAMDRAIAVLDAPDILQHLRDGGTFEDTAGNLFTHTERGLVVTWIIQNRINTREHNIDMFFERLLCDDLRPYHEPPAHGTREWAMENGPLVMHEAHKTEIHVSNITHSFMTTFYDAGWSLYVEPREPGWYSVQIIKTEKTLVAEYWDGNHWCADDDLVDDSFYHWIGKTRIELETPEDFSNPDDFDLSIKIGGTD